MKVLFHPLDQSHGTIYLITFIMFRLLTHLKGNVKPICSVQFNNYLNCSCKIFL